MTAEPVAKVFCLSFQKVGTTSLHEFLLASGLSRCHGPHRVDGIYYMEKVGAVADGSSGNYVFDVSSAAAGTSTAGSYTTIYTSQATDDRRPALAYDATTLSVSEAYHEVRRFRAGTRFLLDCDTVPAGSPTGGVAFIDDATNIGAIASKEKRS